MKPTMKPTMTKRIGFAAMMAAATILPAGAANSFYAPGDLVLFFQEEGGTNTVYANLGNTAGFRGTASGPTGSSTQLNIVNLSTTLTTAFGAGWATNPNIYAGLAGVWGTSPLSSTLQNGDPQRTLYVSDPRNSLANIYQQDSTGYIVSGSTGMSNGASAMTNMNSIFENNYDSQIAISPLAESTIDNNNPFLAANVQGVAFNLFGGGVQQVGTAGNLGSLASIGTVEFALDLHRILARTGISGQVEGPQYESTFEGVVVVGTDGAVSFVAIPEPSTLALSGLATLGLLLRRRRNA